MRNKLESALSEEARRGLVEFLARNGVLRRLYGDEMEFLYKGKEVEVRKEGVEIDLGEGLELDEALMPFLSDEVRIRATIPLAPRVKLGSVGYDVKDELISKGHLNKIFLTMTKPIQIDIDGWSLRLTICGALRKEKLPELKKIVEDMSDEATSIVVSMNISP